MTPLLVRLTLTLALCAPLFAGPALAEEPAVLRTRGDRHYRLYPLAHLQFGW